MSGASNTLPSDLPPKLELPDEAILPIWARHQVATRVTGCSRSKLWALAAEGKIRSCSLREPGMRQATRLFHVPSILDYIESFETKEKGGAE